MRFSALLAAFGLTSLLTSATLAQSTTAPQGAMVGDRISVVVHSGPDIILIPGLASSRDVWRGLAARLQQSHRLHLVQVAGFAGAPAAHNPQGWCLSPRQQPLRSTLNARIFRLPLSSVTPWAASSH
jgi:pimeloyl-ACP methyl ester carboxylesterase